MTRKKISNWSGYRQKTRAIRAGHLYTNENEHNEAIFATSSFIFNDAQTAAAKFEPGSDANIYSRFTNPTVRSFEQRLASLDNAHSCVATSSGMAAILLTCLSTLKAGDHVVCSHSVFGSIAVFFSKILNQFAIDYDFVSPLDIEKWQQSIKPTTRMLFAETPSNPLHELVDITALAQLAHQHDALLVVDNGYCTPLLQRPLSMGADIVVYTTTKFIDGQGRCVGGAIVGSKELVHERVFNVMRTVGVSMSPFNAWVFNSGLQTLGLRLKAISKKAKKLAKWLEKRNEVDKVYYCFLKSHPQYALAKKQQKAGGGTLSFKVKGSKKQAWDFINGTQLMSLSANLGDVRTIITHPATTTHSRLTLKERELFGISDNLIRISVGLEDIDDLFDDFKLGFSAINASQ